MPSDFNALLSVIDRLLYMAELRTRSQQQGLPVHITVKTTELFPPEISRADMVLLVNKLLDTGCLNSAIAKDQPHNELAYALAQEGAVSISFSINTQSLLDYKRTLNAKYKTVIAPLSLKSGNVAFDLDTNTLSLEGRTVRFAPGTLEAALCSTMFARKVGTPVSWDDLYETIQGSANTDTKTGKKSIYDTVKRVNKRIQKELGADEELLSIQRTTVIRNY